MSMIGQFLLVSDDELRAVLALPSTVHGLIDRAYERRGDDFADVDKAWHCLHFLLTGSAWEGEPPLDFIVAGGTEVGDEDVGYGPARAFTSADVRAMADALDQLTASDLVRHFDGKQMDALEIYPAVGSWTEVDPTREETFGYYSGAFDSLKELLQRGRARRLGLLVWLS
jgi:hypothetical protein